jgi:hypothetical protein
MAVGGAQALKARGLEKKVKLVTFDPSPEVIPLFEDGTIQAIAAQNPYQMGYQGVTMLDTIIKGGKIPANQKKIQIPVFIITPDNYKSPDVQKLIQIYGLIDDFAHTQKKAVLFISSDIEEILAVTDRILVMAGGMVIAQRLPRETTKQEILEICMRGSQKKEG